MKSPRNYYSLKLLARESTHRGLTKVPYLGGRALHYGAWHPSLYIFSCPKRMGGSPGPFLIALCTLQESPWFKRILRLLPCSGHEPSSPPRSPHTTLPVAPPLSTASRFPVFEEPLIPSRHIPHRLSAQTVSSWGSPYLDIRNPGAAPFPFTSVQAQVVSDIPRLFVSKSFKDLCTSLKGFPTVPFWFLGLCTENFKIQASWA